MSAVRTLGLALALTSCTASSNSDRPRPTVDLAVGMKRLPLRAGPAISVTSDGVYLEHRKFAEVLDGSVDPRVVEGHLVKPLYDDLERLSDEAQAFWERHDMGTPDRITLIPDRNTRFGTVVDLLYTAGRAEWTGYDLIHATADGSATRMPFDPPKFGGHRGPACAHYMARERKEPCADTRLHIHVARDQIRISAKTLEEPVSIQRDAPDALDRLQGTVEELHSKALADDDVVDVSAASDIPIGDVLRVVDAAAGRNCDFAKARSTVRRAEIPDSCMFWDALLEAAPD